MSWDQLSMRERGEIMKSALEYGIRDIQQIRALYDQANSAQEQQNNVAANGGYMDNLTSKPFSHRPIPAVRFDNGGQAMSYVQPSIAMAQDNTNVQRAVLPAQPIKMTNEAYAQHLKQQQGTISQSNFKGDGMTTQERNQAMYNPQGISDVVKGARARAQMEYENGNSVWNGLETVGKTAISSGAVSAAPSLFAGKAAQAAQTAANMYKAYSLAQNVQGAANSAAKGDVTGAVSNTLGIMGKSPSSKASFVGKLGKQMLGLFKKDGGYVDRITDTTEDSLLINPNYDRINLDTNNISFDNQDKKKDEYRYYEDRYNEAKEYDWNQSVSLPKVTSATISTKKKGKKKKK